MIGQNIRILSPGWPDSQPFPDWSNMCTVVASHTQTGLTMFKHSVIFIREKE